jgi:hypothetical protein
MDFGVIPVTGNLAFDYFFTLPFVLGLVAIGPALLFKLFRG